MLNADVLFEIFSILNRSTSDIYTAKWTFTPLRLVNKAFCEAASPFLFRTVCLIPRHFSQSVERLYDMSSSQLAGYFQTLVIYSPSTSRISGAANRHLFMNGLAVLLPICMENFPTLQTISIRIHGPPNGTSLQRQFDNCLLTALRSAPLPNLKSLQLTAEDYNQLLLASPGTRSLGRFMSRLQHLSVAFEDGYKDYYNLPLTYPNPRWEGEFFPFFRLATNLRSLTIKSERPFDLDHLGQLNMQNLDSLELCGVDVKSHTLLSLLSPLQTSFRHLILQDVKLKDGTWKIIFRHLHDLPTFISLKTDSSGYSPNGQSVRHIRPIHARDPHMELESSHFPDYVALILLKKAVETRRKEARLPSMDEIEAVDDESGL